MFIGTDALFDKWVKCHFRQSNFLFENLVFLNSRFTSLLISNTLNFYYIFMKNLSLKLCGLFVVSSLFFASCVSSKKFKELEASKMSVDQQLTTAQSTIQTLEGEKGTLMGQNSDLESMVSQIKSDLEGVKGEIAGFKTKITTAEKTISEKDAAMTSLRNQVSGAFSNLNSSGLSIITRGDQLYVSMAEKLLFNSGSSRVNSSGRAVLDNLAGVLAKNPTLKVMVEGHTDSRASESSNWDLSVDRATSVVKRLVKGGVNASNLIAAGRGEHMPAVTEVKGDNETYKQNRRVEIALIPSVTSLYNIR